MNPATSCCKASQDGLWLSRPPAATSAERASMRALHIDSGGASTSTTATAAPLCTSASTIDRAAARTICIGNRIIMTKRSTVDHMS